MISYDDNDHFTFGCGLGMDSPILAFLKAFDNGVNYSVLPYWGEPVYLFDWLNINSFCEQNQVTIC